MTAYLPQMLQRRLLSHLANPFHIPKHKFLLPHPNPKSTHSPPPHSSSRVALYLQRARLIDSIRLSLRLNPAPHPNSHLSTIDSFVATHALRSSSSPDSALSLFHSLTSIPNFTHTQNTIHAMAKILASAARLTELQDLIRAVNSGEFPGALPPAPMDLLRWYVSAGDAESACRVWTQMRANCPKRVCTESYNLMIGLLAKNGDNCGAVRVFLQLIKEGANPNSRTYTILTEHLAAAKRLDVAMEVFECLPAMRIRRTSKQYLLLIQRFLEAGRLNVVVQLVAEMRRDGILPGQSLHSVFVQLYEAGFVEEMEDLIRDFSPDERIDSLGFYIYRTDDEDESDDVDGGDNDQAGLRLKPWLDPSALASALGDWNPDEVSALESAKFVWTTRLVCKLLRAFKRAETAWDFFCWVAYQPGGFMHDAYTVSRMIAILARSGHVELVDHLLLKIKREGIQLSFSTVRLVIDLYGLSKKADAALRLFHEAELVCGPISKLDLGLLYSSLLRTFVKCKKSSEAVDLVEEMESSGLVPDIQTFSGLMQHFALQGDLRRVQQLFGRVRRSGLTVDPYMFQILLRAFCKQERAALALRVFEDMRAANLWPDASTKALLVKSLWKEGKLREAASVEEKCEVVESLPAALPGHVWTVNSGDLKHVYDVYSSAFTVKDH